MITPAYSPTATERVLPRLALDFTTASLDSRVTITRALNTATRIDSSGNIVGVNADLPRFDFDPITGVCRGLLIEETRANLLIASANLTDAAWQNVTATIATSAVLSPDGVNFAQTITSTANGSRVQQFVTATSTSQTYSFFMKQGNTAVGRVRLYNNTTAANVCEGFLTFSTEQFTIDGGAGTATVTKLKNGWYRVAIAATTGITVGNSLRCFIYPGNSTSSAGDFMYAWGAQLEAGAFATSYIPTTTTSLTRNADVVTMTGTNFSDWYNASEGTFVVGYQAYASGTNLDIFMAHAGAPLTNSIGIYAGSNDIGWVRTGGATQANIASGVANVTTPHKTALAYKANDFAISSAGSAVVFDSAGTVPIVDRLTFGANNIGGLRQAMWLISLRFFPIRLLNNELIAFSK